MKNRDRLDPIDRDILRTLKNVKMRVTPSEVARSINIHPTTAKSRIEFLRDKDMIDCKERGNRWMCKINLSGLIKNKKMF